jgi:hypothetical protein
MVPTPKVMVMTQRDEEILAALTTCVKAFSINQIQRTWWPDASPRCVLDRVRVLSEAGWISLVTVMVRDIAFDPKGPFVRRICPKDSVQWHDILRVSHKRWQVPLRPAKAIVATPRAARFFGGLARHPRPSEATHDLFLTAVYILFRHSCSRKDFVWQGESMLARCLAGREGVIPDALIHGSAGDVAIEVVGESYSQSKLQSFHDYCASQGWSYELW